MSLNVFSVYINPQRWRSRLENFRKFEAGVVSLGLPLTTVELQYGLRPWDLPEQDGVIRVRFKARDVLWHKENGLNLAAAHTPGWERAVCMDGDMHMVDPTWTDEVNDVLDLYPVAQVSSELIFLGPHGEHVARGPSLTHLLRMNPHGKPITKGSHGYPGGIWAYRREAWDAIGGMMDRCIVGGGDHHMATALLGLEQAGEPSDVTAPYNRYITTWQERAVRQISHHVGLARGLAVHYWHGPIANRQYSERWKILQRHAYDPMIDVHTDANGVLRLSDNKPVMRNELHGYFKGRNEDTQDVTNVTQAIGS